MNAETHHRAGAPQRIRVLIADDSAAFRSAVGQLLERLPHVEAIGAAEDGVHALALAASLVCVTPALRTQGWWGLTMMSPATAVVFAVLGAAMVLDSWRDALGPTLTQFSGHVWLALPESEAMKLVESTGPEAEANRAKARMMMFDEKYHQAKTAVMGPIHDFLVLVDQRTLAAVHAAEKSATIFRGVFIAFGLGLLLALWRTYVALGDTLGPTAISANR
ncbi:MAG: hypothetical protein HY736_17080 [Verrucomicrobia bacterium]|nr:hypothetical protein [Verrucomicrobiota bacterium]